MVSTHGMFATRFQTPAESAQVLADAMDHPKRKGLLDSGVDASQRPLVEFEPAAGGHEADYLRPVSLQEDLGEIRTGVLPMEGVG